MMNTTCGWRLANAALVAVLAVGACAPANTVPAAATGGATPTPEESREQAYAIPAGYGTLRQDEFTLTLRDGDLLLKVTPLEESVIRLAAPDTYQRLKAMADSRMQQARDAIFAGEPELMLVSFFSYSPDVTYRPEELQVMHQGRLMRPVSILPVTSGWGRGRLQQREVQNAVFVFDEDLDYAQPMTVRYGPRTSDDWSAIIPTLERERARVRARAGS
ncbi:MAG TPA: hypothetical protein VMN78_07305 [Longimicrobiales bacterium]|nr:hypothetical protein [Longimicrobiales bacterium]